MLLTRVRNEDRLTVAIIGTQADAAARQGLVDAFEKSTGIRVRTMAIQSVDWQDFFSKILTMVAAGTPPDVVNVATEGAQLFAERDQPALRRRRPLALRQQHLVPEGAVGARRRVAVGRVLRRQRHQFGAGYAIMKTAKDREAAWQWLTFTASLEGMRHVFANPNTTPSRRSMVNEELFGVKGPRHWKRFYETLDRFPSTGPIPAPPQQGSVETALIKNVSLAVGGSEAQMKGALQSLQRDLELALRRTA